MARSQLYTRWAKYKASRRKTSAKPFSQKALSGMRKNSRSGSTRELTNHEVFSNGYRGSGGAERNFERLREYIRTSKPHHYYMYMLFKPAIQEAAEALDSDDPKMNVEILLDRYRQQDPELRVFQFESVVLERSNLHLILMFFRGRDCFIIFRKGKTVKQSRMYHDTEELKRMACGRLKAVEWAGEIELDRESLAEVPDC